MKLLPIARPCPASFERMRGDDQTRFCEICDKRVHDLSARTEEEARALLAAARGTRICVRFARNAQGSVRFRAAVVAAAISVSACSSPLVNAPPAPSAPPQKEEVVDHDMGDMIPDDVDKCPDDPESSDGSDGCPTAPSPQRPAPAPSSSK